MIEICDLLWTSCDTFDDCLKHDTAFSLDCKFSAYIRHTFMHKNESLARKQFPMSKNLFLYLNMRIYCTNEYAIVIQINLRVKMFANWGTKF